MKKRLFSLFLSLAVTLSLTALPVSAESGSPAVSDNINDQDYTSWSKPVASYLMENEAGGLTRVEYIDGQVVVEDYASDFTFQSGRTIPMELSLWGGFFAGADYNFLVFGQKNPDENDSTEVVRVVKYSKDWQRLGQASLYGANTTTPFDAGSLRMDEYGGQLYIRTCHQMYASSDGLHHQANLTICVEQESMTILDSYSQVMNPTVGYVSHSFNQFVLADSDQNIITLDHGDAYPRGAALMRYNAKAGSGKFSGLVTNISLQKFSGQTGDNTTGASLGGLAETSSGYVAAYNYDGAAGSGPRTVYLGYVPKDGVTASSRAVSSAGTTTPQLVSTGLNGGYLLWNDKEDRTAGTTLSYVSYDSTGGTGPVQTAAGSLSDCAPIYYNGQAVWYTTDDSAPTFYTLDASGVTAHPLGGNQTDPAPSATPVPSATPSPSVTPTPTPSQQPSDSGAPLDPRSAPTLAEAVERANILAGRFISGYEPYIDSVDVFAAVDANGTLWGWGDSQCLLGKGGSEIKQPVSLMEQVSQVALVQYGSECAILVVKEDNTLWGWGKLGPMGFLNDWDDTTPTPMKLMDDVKSVAGGKSGAMVIKQDSTLWFLGSPTEGQDGSGIWYTATADRPAGVYKVMDQVEMVACGFRRFAALKTDGSVWVWGTDGYSGDGKLICLLGDQPQKPTKILDNIISVGMYEENGWAIDANGGLWSWGLNDYNEVGNGGSYDTTDPFTYSHAQVKPVKILDSGVISAAPCMAVTRDGTCYRWSDQLEVPEQYRGSTPVKAGSNMVIASNYVRPDGELLATNRDNIDFYNMDPSTRMKLIHFMDGFFQPQADSQPDPEPSPEPGSASFSDVSASHWAYADIQRAAGQGWINGVGGGRFNPGGTLSSYEFFTLLGRAFYPEDTQTAQAAHPDEEWWYAPCTAAYQHGVLDGTAAGDYLEAYGAWAAQYLSPAISRQDMAQAIANLMEDQGFTVTEARKTAAQAKIGDWAGIPASYRDAVSSVYALGIITGTSQGTFAPDQSMTRAEAAAVLCRLADALADGR